MIPDNFFKTLMHGCKGYDKHLKGGSLEEVYRPDYVLEKGHNSLIPESENATSRKTFIGGMMRVEHFLKGARKGKFIFFIVPKPNTTFTAIAWPLKRYSS